MLHRKKRSLVIGFCGVLVTVAAIALTAASRINPAPATTAASSTRATAHPIQGPSGSGSYDAGLPAITPHLKGSGPSFTAKDARAFVTKNGLPRMDIQGSINVVAVVFGISTHIQQQYVHANFGVGSDRLICFVEIQNTISTPHPAGLGTTFSHGFAIFDAHTGNILGSGAFN